jgi:hypothetical protein
MLINNFSNNKEPIISLVSLGGWNFELLLKVTLINNMTLLTNATLHHHHTRGR